MSGEIVTPELREVTLARETRYLGDAADKPAPEGPHSTVHVRVTSVGELNEEARSMKSGRTWTMYGLRAKTGAYELAPAATTNYLTYAGVELQVGTNTTPVRRTAHPLNITTSQ